MKVACLTVFYKGMEQFIEDYMECIVNQTYKDFTMVIINDNFPLDINEIVNDYKIKSIIINQASSPQKNRIFGLGQCLDNGFDIVICSDSDETMYCDRIEHNINYFLKNPNKNIVYNNSVGKDGDKYFDLFYKDKITFNDIIDFNVLGYGAMNLKKSVIPFIINNENKKIKVFDWWIASIYLLYNNVIDVLEYAKNDYRLHEDNFIGPLYEINQDKIKLGLDVKLNHYNDLESFCYKNNFMTEFKNIKEKKLEILEIKDFIKEKSLAYYSKIVRDYFADKEKIYWWGNVVSLKKLGV